MDILFIHGNYPAQFRHLCTGLGNNHEHRVIFLTAREDATKEPLTGVEIATYSTHRSASRETHHYLQATEESVLQGQAVLRSLDALLQKGFHPRLVIFHAGMGLGLFLRDVLPNAVLIGYFEWWFTPETTRHLVEDFDLNMQLSSGLRNLPILRELERCDAAVVPTEWQKQQFPSLVQSKLTVIFDGIDTSFFHANRKELCNQELILRNRESREMFRFTCNDCILSYATRGMEPIRGFPEFMHSLPNAFATIPNLHVVIAGADRRAYSYGAPSHNGSWKEHLLDKLGKRIPQDRIHFTGLLSYSDYRALLWRSDLHCYFTRPYVTSWSFFEAIACEATVLTNHCEATDNIAIEGTYYKTDLDNQNAVNSSIVEILHKQTRLSRLRGKLRSGFDLKTSIRDWSRLINQTI